MSAADGWPGLDMVEFDNRGFPNTAYRPSPAPAPDLLAESRDRAEEAEAVALDELGPRMPCAGEWVELPATRRLRDPYGPDPVVFGVVPRVTRSATRETGT